MDRWRITGPPETEGEGDTPPGGLGVDPGERWPRIPQLESSSAMHCSEQDRQHTQGRAPDSGDGEAPGRDDHRQETAFDVVPVPRAARPQKGHEPAGTLL